MKTPRELLLARHATVQPRLDALRREVVAGYVSTPATDNALAQAGFLARLWVELFWSCRRRWLGLAAAWAIVLAFNLAGREASSPPLVSARQTRPGAELRLALGEQRRLLAELLGTSLLPPVERRKSAVPTPRSEAASGQSAA